MEKFSSSLNSHSAYQSKEERKEYKKEYNKEQMKEYREINKNKILEYKKIKIICDICNTETTKSNIKQHQRTNKCMFNII